MKETDVLIIGSGSAGCAAAIELAKKDIPVTLITTTAQVQDAGSALLQSRIELPADMDSLSKTLQEQGKGLSCPRATEQFARLAPPYLEKFLQGELKLEPENTGSALMDALQKRLSEFPQITVLTQHTAVDLITLEKHSTKDSDVYKKPTCLGAYVLNESTGEIETYLAKETILATGGFSSIFLHSTNPKHARGDGLAMAQRAGARLIQLDKIYFHPLSLKEADGCKRLSEQLWGQGAKLRFGEGPWIQADQNPFSKLSQTLYQQMQDSGVEQAWLDVTDCSNVEGMEPGKEHLPVVPAAHYCMGGIAVDRNGQTSLSRLHAIGQVACTGLFGTEWQPSVSVIAAMLWGQCCAEDVAKQISKFAYYSPKVKPMANGDSSIDKALVKQDWLALKHSCWNGLGPVRKVERIHRSQQDCQRMLHELERQWSGLKLCGEALALRNALQVGSMVAAQALA